MISSSNNTKLHRKDSNEFVWYTINIYICSLIVGKQVSIEYLFGLNPDKY